MTTVKPYVWRTGETETPGALVRHSGRAQIFIPMDELTRISDQLIDIVEKHDRKAN